MLALMLAAALQFTQSDARIAYDTAKELVDRCTPRDGGTVRARIAANFLLDKASAAGGDVRRDTFLASTPQGDRSFTNLYAEFKTDAEDSWVVLVSHYDTKPGIVCPGANDGAATSGLLVGLVNAYSAWDAPRGNLLMVWTDGEENMRAYSENDGFWGSKRAVEYIRQRGYRIKAVICLDMLGDRDLAITVPTNGSVALAKISVIAAERAGFPGLVKRGEESVKDDHVAFLDAGYKAIDMIDFNYGPDNRYWHTAEDTIDKISDESLLKSGKVVAEMLNILL